MSTILWNFAASNGGRDAGINDPGLQTFRDNFYRYLARELIQNSLDVSTLKHAREALDGRVVRCLRVGDRNTRGVRGSDYDRTGDWYNLVRCAGSSAKGGGEGGSFGIGKNAPFAASEARTVLYSTKTSDGVAFQGVSLLATHQDMDGSTKQPTGYLGSNEGMAIRTLSEIPERFRRTEMGTDIWIIGYPQRSQWQADLLFSVLDSFWPAIEFGLLTVQIGNISINKENLRVKLAEFSSAEGFTGHIYYAAYTNPKVREIVQIRDLGECFIYLNSDEMIATKRVAMVRKSGMIINQRPFRWPIAFSGVFVCRNEIGNKRLRDMEPPRHDEWSADLPEHGAGKRIVDAIGHEVRQAIKKLMPVDDVQELAIPGLEKFLPDPIEDRAIGLWDGTNSEKPKAESSNSVMSVTPVRAIKLRPSKQVPEQTEVDGENIEEMGQGEEPSEIGEKRRQVGEGGARANGDDGTQNAGGATRGQRPRIALPIRYRSFVSDVLAGRYSISISSSEDVANAMLSAYAVGDDARSLLPIQGARFSKGEAIPVNGGIVGPLKLASNSATRLEMFLNPGTRYALEIVAHEA